MIHNSIEFIHLIILIILDTVPTLLNNSNKDESYYLISGYTCARFFWWCSVFYIFVLSEMFYKQATKCLRPTIFSIRWSVRLSTRFPEQLLFIEFKHCCWNNLPNVVLPWCSSNYYKHPKLWTFLFACFFQKISWSRKW